EVARQCQRYLSKKDIALVFENSTAMAALKVKGLADRAAIISKRASEIYGLRILESDIQDSKDNVTEFIVLSH
ncbi:MAG: prephenate dehydratase domain-containing protein, partial [Candidatus Pacearchaeota archaeon]